MEFKIYLVKSCVMLNVKTDYLRKVIVQDRSPKYTNVGEIMTDQVGDLYLHVFGDLS